MEIIQKNIKNLSVFGDEDARRSTGRREDEAVRDEEKNRVGGGPPVSTLSGRLNPAASFLLLSSPLKLRKPFARPSPKNKENKKENIHKQRDVSQRKEKVKWGDVPCRSKVFNFSHFVQRFFLAMYTLA